MSAIKLRSILLVTFVTAMLTPAQVEPKATFGIGMRIIGDQLLVRDVLQVRSNGLEQSATICFNYAIPEPITYIEILSEENVLAEVNFSYQHDLVKGTVTAINATSAEIATATIPIIQPPPFEVLITIYGFNETMLNLNPAYILNRDQTFEGFLEPQLNDEALLEGEFDDVNDNVTVDDAYETFDENNDEDLDLDDEEEAGIGDEEGLESDALDADFEHADKTIEVGRRQNGDYLIYETVQTSSSSTEEPTNHSVVFYYVDSNFITYARFVIYDHYIDKPTHDDYMPPIAEYTHYSPNTLKAIITDHRTTSLFVQMFLYGYQPADLPDAYAAFLQNSLRDSGEVGSATEPTLSPLQRLQKLMKQQGASITTSKTEGQRRSSYSPEEVEENGGENKEKAANNAAATAAEAATSIVKHNAASMPVVSPLLSILMRFFFFPMWLWLLGGSSVAATARRHI